jgi:hypothetical protein
MNLVEIFKNIIIFFIIHVTCHLGLIFRKEYEDDDDDDD